MNRYLAESVWMNRCLSDLEAVLILQQVQLWMIQRLTEEIFVVLQLVLLCMNRCLIYLWVTLILHHVQLWMIQHLTDMLAVLILQQVQLWMHVCLK